MTSHDAARASFVGVLRARQAEMQGLIDRILAWVGADTEEAMEEVVEHETAHQRRARKPAQPAAQQSLL